MTKNSTQSAALPRQIPAAAPALHDADEKFSWFMAAVFAACYWFVRLLILTAAWPGSSMNYYKIYAATLFVVLPLGLLSALLIRKVHHIQMWDNENFLPALIGTQTLFWAWIWCHPTPELLSPDLLASISWAVPRLALLAFVAAILSGHARRGYWTSLYQVALLALPPAALALLWHFNAGVNPGGSFVQITEAALVLTAALLIGRNRPAPKLNVLDWGLALVLVLATLSVAPEYNIYHQNTYLGPIHSVLTGRSMLVNILCEYGVAVIYFLAAIFKLLGLKPVYGPFTVILMVFTAVEYVVLFWMARKTFRSRLMAALCVATVLCLNRYGTFWQWDEFTYPSVGPLRFGIPILILASGYQRRSKQSLRWACVELGLLGLASIWSLETLVYSLSAWGFSAGADAWGQASGFLDFVRRCLRHALQAAAAIAIAYACLTLLTLLRAGTWLHWDGYLAWMTIYSGDAASWPLVVWIPWILLPGVACLSLLASAVVLHEGKSVGADTVMLAGVAGAAASEFTYFFMRAAPNNIGHCAPLCIFLFFYWVDRAWARTDWSGLARWTMTPVAFFVLAALGWNAWSAINTRYSQSVLYWLYQDEETVRHGGQHLALPGIYAQLWSPQPCAGQWVIGSLNLIQRWAPDQKAVAVFAPDSVEIYALSDKTNPFPIAFADEERWIKAHYKAMETDPLPLKAGDVMLVGADAQGSYVGPPVLPYTAVDLDVLLDSVRKKFKLLPLQYDPSGVWAVRLAPLDAAAAPLPAGKAS